MDKFALTAQLLMRAPANLMQTVRTVKDAFKDIDVNVKVKTDVRALQGIENDLKRLRDAGKQTSQFYNEIGGILANATRRFAGISIATGTFLGLARAIKNGIGDAIVFEREMAKIAQATDSSIHATRALAKEIGDIGKKYGSASDELVKFARNFAQAGFNARETSAALDLLARTDVIGTFGTMESTMEGIITTQAVFNKNIKGSAESVQFLESTFDAINKVSKKYAIESDDIITAVRRTGAVFEAAGGSVNELMAIMTSVRATTRESADTIANGFKTIFTRLQRKDTLDSLKELGIELETLDGKFIGPYQAIQKIGIALSSLPEGSIQKNNILEQIGGVYQIGRLIPAIKNYSLQQQILNEANSAGGDINKDLGKSQETLANKIMKTKESFTNLIREIALSDGFKKTVSMTLSLGDAFIRMADSLKSLLPMLSLYASYAVAKTSFSFISSFAGGKVSAPKTGAGRALSSSPVGGYASGGFVTGVPGIDKNPAMLTKDEFVVNSRDSKKNKGLLTAINSGKKVKMLNKGTKTTNAKKYDDYGSDRDNMYHDLVLKSQMTGIDDSPVSTPKKKKRKISRSEAVLDPEVYAALQASPQVNPQPKAPNKSVKNMSSDFQDMVHAQVEEVVSGNKTYKSKSSELNSEPPLNSAAGRKDVNDANNLSRISSNVSGVAKNTSSKSIMSLDSAYESAGLKKAVETKSKETEGAISLLKKEKETLARNIEAVKKHADVELGLVTEIEQYKRAMKQTKTELGGKLSPLFTADLRHQNNLNRKPSTSKALADSAIVSASLPLDNSSKSVKSKKYSVSGPAKDGGEEVAQAADRTGIVLLGMVSAISFATENIKGLDDATKKAVESSVAMGALFYSIARSSLPFLVGALAKAGPILANFGLWVTSSARSAAASLVMLATSARGAAASETAKAAANVSSAAATTTASTAVRVGLMGMLSPLNLFLIAMTAVVMATQYLSSQLNSMADDFSKNSSNTIKDIEKSGVNAGSYDKVKSNDLMALQARKAGTNWWDTGVSNEERVMSEKLSTSKVLSADTSFKYNKANTKIEQTKNISPEDALKELDKVSADIIASAKYSQSTFEDIERVQKNIVGEKTKEQREAYENAKDIRDSSAKMAQEIGIKISDKAFDIIAKKGVNAKNSKDISDIVNSTEVQDIFDRATSVYTAGSLGTGKQKNEDYKSFVNIQRKGSSNIETSMSKQIELQNNAMAAREAEVKLMLEVNDQLNNLAQSTLDLQKSQKSIDIFNGSSSGGVGGNRFSDLSRVGDLGQFKKDAYEATQSLGKDGKTISDQLVAAAQAFSELRDGLLLDQLNKTGEARINGNVNKDKVRELFETKSPGFKSLNENVKTKVVNDMTDQLQKGAIGLDDISKNLGGILDSTKPIAEIASAASKSIDEMINQLKGLNNQLFDSQEKIGGLKGGLLGIAETGRGRLFQAGKYSATNNDINADADMREASRNAIANTGLRGAGVTAGDANAKNLELDNAIIDYNMQEQARIDKLLSNNPGKQWFGGEYGAFGGRDGRIHRNAMEQDSRNIGLDIEDGKNRIQKTKLGNIGNFGSFLTNSQNKLNANKKKLEGNLSAPERSALTTENQKLDRAIKATTEELTRLANQSDRASDVMAKIEMEQGRKDFMKGKVSDFVLGGAEDRMSMQEQFKGLQSVMDTGSFQNLPEDLRKSVDGLIQETAKFDPNNKFVKAADNAKANDFKNMMGGKLDPEFEKMLRGGISEKEAAARKELADINALEIAAQKALILAEENNTKAINDLINVFKAGAGAGLNPVQNQVPGQNQNFIVFENLNKTLETTVNRIPESMDMFSTSLGTVTASLDGIAQSLSNITMKHEVNIGGQLSVAGFNTEKVAEALKDSLGEFISIAVKDSIDKQNKAFRTA